ncbi:MAG TPA: EAL domain-containing protein [Gallionellaceae bacterium]
MVSVFALGFVLQAVSPLLSGLGGDRQVQNLALHGAVEMAGAVISAMVAYLLLRLNSIAEGSTFNYRIAAALLAMSGLDGLHAMMPAGEIFVWLHSSATALGGLLFALIWFPALPLRPYLKYWPVAVMLISIALGAYSLVQPEKLPRMLEAGQFTRAAVIMNIGGGVLFLLSAAKLLLTYRNSGKSEDLLFLFQCLILASAAITFQQSSLWDLSWWGWHFERLGGYALTLWLVVKTAHAIEQKTLLGNQLLRQQMEERRESEIQLRIAAATFETHEAIMITDADANIIRVNHAFEEITGYSADEVIGKNPSMLGSGRHDAEFYAQMWQEIRNTGTWSGEIWDRNKIGNIYTKETTISAVKNEKGEVTQYVSIFTDISHRKKTEEEMYSLAFFDPLTKLPNRRLLLDRLGGALSLASRSHKYGAVMFIDLDKFKVLNDMLGHDYGDLLLTEVASRLRFCSREADSLARIGGDEFVVLIENISFDKHEALQSVAKVGEKIRATLAKPYQLRENIHHSSPSIGVYLFCGDNESVDDVIKRADTAMYMAKDSGRNRVRFFDPLLQQSIESRAVLELDLRRAISSQQFQLYYQIQLNSGLQPIGAEALIRWIHPARGMVPPALFIPVAEESSLILEISNWVLETACQQLAAWQQQEKMRDLVLAINISAVQFKQTDFVAQVKAAIDKHGIEPSRLKLELTESIALDNLDFVIAKMHELKQELGVGLSLDDFGTGYSSLSYLKQLPLNQLKIDQSFVRDIKPDGSDSAMVKAIIDMAKNFDLDVIAEGVETDAQLAFLAGNGCLAYQGFLFSQPVPVEQFEAVLLRWGAQRQREG